MIKVKITIEDDKGKKSEIEIEEKENDLTKLIIIQNVFNLFGVHNDIIEMAASYSKIGKAYSSFFSNVHPIEHEAIEKMNSVDVKQTLSDDLQENEIELETTYKTVDDQPSYLQTGIKIDEDGRKRYKLRYKCDVCDHPGVHYIFEKSKFTWCHNCKYEMPVHPAHPIDGERDTFGCFFRAGEHKDANLDWSLKDKN